MVDHITVIPDGLRGGGHLLETRRVIDFVTLDCDLVLHTESIDDELVNVFRVSTGISEGYTVSEVMTLITKNLVKNLVFSNNQIRYTSIAPSEINTMEDLNGVVTGIIYTNGKIVYDLFESNNSLLYDDDLTELAGAITNLRYTNTSILYDTIGEISE